MWAEDGTLKYKKAIVANAKEFLAFYHENIAGKACAWHARMMTHGDINLENAHPYPVFGFDGKKAEGLTLPLLIMHNGILDTGNAQDRSKSDTWHYVRDYLQPMLRNNTEFTFTQAFRTIIGKHIGTNNRFVFMDPLGRVSIVNKGTGVEYAGAWFSNTYAWNAYHYLPSGGRQYLSNGKTYTSLTAASKGSSTAAGRTTWDDMDVAEWNAANEKQGLTGAPKSKNQRRRERKAAALEARKEYAKLMSSPTSTTATPTSSTTGSAFSDSRVPQEVVDDVLEGRSILEVAYPDAVTKDSELAMMVQAMTPEKFFLALELLMDGKLNPKTWDSMAKSPTVAANWAKFVTKTMFENTQPLYGKNAVIEAATH